MNTLTSRRRVRPRETFKGGECVLHLPVDGTRTLSILRIDSPNAHRRKTEMKIFVVVGISAFSRVIKLVHAEYAIIVNFALLDGNKQSRKCITLWWRQYLLVPQSPGGDESRADPGGTSRHRLRVLPWRVRLTPDLRRLARYKHNLFEWSQIIDLLYHGFVKQKL